MHTRVETSRRCYSIYLWAYTVALSGGAVHFDLNEESMEELGVNITIAHQKSALLGVQHARPSYQGAGPAREPMTYADFDVCFKIEEIEKALELPKEAGESTS
jgi:hypothetical protein